MPCERRSGGAECAVNAMTTICGVDGCKAGWVAISKDLDSDRISWSVHSTFQKVALANPSLQVIAIDIPIGLPERGARQCDLQARRRLGPPRSSSVFPAPIRPVLTAESADEASAIRYGVEAKKMSRQAFAILPKIRQVDAALRGDPELRRRVREIHPEVCFYFLAGGRPMHHSKKTVLGRAERKALLTPVFGDSVSEALEHRKILESAMDDVLDAFAALWTAERIVNGGCEIIPAIPLLDAFGLRMEMVA